MRVESIKEGELKQIKTQEREGKRASSKAQRDDKQDGGRRKR